MKARLKKIQGQLFEKGSKLKYKKGWAEQWDKNREDWDKDVSIGEWMQIFDAQIRESKFK